MFQDEAISLPLRTPQKPSIFCPMKLHQLPSFLQRLTDTIGMPPLRPGQMKLLQTEIRKSGRMNLSTLLEQQGLKIPGRSDTVQFGHLSEPAHYANDEGIKAGLLQTISDALYTEVWWETTANGMNWLYNFVMAILEGKVPDYEVIFIPWFWTDKYSIAAPADFKRTEEEELLASLGTWFNRTTEQIESRPLTNDQLHWRRVRSVFLVSACLNRNTQQL